MKEEDIQDRARQAMSMEPGLVMFRNPVGAGYALRNGAYVEFGLGGGSSDLVGFQSVIITPEMVGKRLAVFVAVEMKKPGHKTDKRRLAEQRQFIDIVREHGGAAGFAESVDEALAIPREVLR